MLIGSLGSTDSQSPALLRSYICATAVLMWGPIPRQKHRSGTSVLGLPYANGSCAIRRGGSEPWDASRDPEMLSIFRSGFCGKATNGFVPQSIPSVEPQTEMIRRSCSITWLIPKVSVSSLLRCAPRSIIGPTPSACAMHSGTKYVNLPTLQCAEVSYRAHFHDA